MSPIIKSVLFLTILGSTQAFAEKMLVPPTHGAPECYETYANAAQPKTADTVRYSMTAICLNKGGLRVLQKNWGDANHPAGISFSCIDDNPNDRLFSCEFSTSYEDL